MAEFTTRDGTQIFFKDWGSGQPIVFSHGWPLSADDWDAQMLFFLQHGYRVIAHDRRGHGRSAQPSEGNDMDHYADDLADLVQHLDLHDAIHIGHSAGGGEVARYIGRHGESRVAKVILVSAVTPSVLQTDANPAGCRRPDSRACRPGSRETARSSTGPCPPGRSTTSTSRAWSRQSRSSRTGGARA
jgi:non-heme chloroperoxidase